MAQSILLKRSSVAGNVPSSSDLSLGEIAINTADGAVYIKKGNNDIVAVHDNDILHINTSNSRVGIGTTTPVNTLHVHTTSNSQMQFTDDTSGSGSSDGLRVGWNGSMGQMYLFENADMRFATNNIERVRIKNDGKVGIGVNDPATRLEVKHDSNESTGITVENTSTGTGARAMVEFKSDAGQLNVYATGSNYNGVASWSDAGVLSTSSTTTGGLILNTQSGGIKFQYGTTERMRVHTNGNIGINETTPLSKFEVAGSIKATSRDSAHTSEAGVTLSYDTSNSIGLLETWTSKPLLTRTYNYQAFDISGTEMMRINATGVGIGTNNPQDRLHVTLDSATTNAEVEVMRVEATSTGTPVDGFGPFIDFRGDRQAGNPDSYGRIGFESDGMTPTTVDGAFIIQPAEDGSYTERMRVSSDGKVGIGTSSPANLLSVESTGQFAGINIKSASSNGISYIDFGDADDNNIGGINYDNSTNTLQLRNNNTHHVFLKSSGNLGIGTGSPSRKLHVSGSGATVGIKVEATDGNQASLDLTNTEGAVRLINDGGSFFIHDDTDSAERLRINTSGNIGIGTNSPDTKLDITAAGVEGLIMNQDTGNSSASGRIFFKSTERTNTILNVSGNLEFRTGANIGSSSGTVRMTIVGSTGAVKFNNAYTFPTSDGSANQVLQTDGSGNLSFATVSGGGGSTDSITDADGDTKIQVEESSDEDQIRFDAAGIERFRVGSDVQVLAATDFNITGASRRLNFTSGTGTVRTTTANSLILATNNTTALTIDSSQDATFAGDIHLADTKGVYLGGSNDLQLYHNGSHSLITNQTGDLYIRNQTNDGDIIFQADDGSGGDTTYLTLDGSNERIVISKNVTHSDDVRARFGASNDLQIFHDATDSQITNATGDFYLDQKADDKDIIFRSDNGSGGLDVYFRADGSTGEAKLYNYGNLKLTAKSDGVDITGELQSDSLDVDGNADISGNLVLGGNLTVNGTTTTINSTTLTVDDKNITLASGSSDSSAANGAGLTVDCGSDTDTTFTYNGSSGQWETNTELVIKPRHTGGTPPTLTLTDLNNQYQAGIVSSGHLTMRASGSGNQYWQNGGTYLMMLTSGGDLSIGNSTTAPTNHRVHIKTAVDNSVSQGLVIERSNNTDRGYINYQGGGFQFRSTVGDPINLGETDAVHMRINPTTGNVGIGTTSPGAQLHVDGSTGIIINDSATGTTTKTTLIPINSAGNSQLKVKGGNYVHTVSYETSWNDFEYARLVSSYNTGDSRFDLKKSASDGSTAATTRISTGTSYFNGSVGIGDTSPDFKLAVRTPAIPSGSTYAWPLDLSRPNTDNRGLTFGVAASGTTNAIAGHNADVGIGHTYGTDSNGLPQYYETLRIKHIDQASGQVGIGVTDPKAKLQVEEYGIDTTSTSSSATTQIAIHTFAATDFRSARFTVQVTNSTDSTYHTTELLLVHDGTTANITEFGEIHTGSAVEATFDCDVNSGNVRLLATPASTDTMAFKVVCHSITT